MSGVWMFKNGVYRLVENPPTGSEKVLVYEPTGEVISSYAILQRILIGLGWERYYDDADLIQFHRASSIDLISLPRDFSRFRSVHMYDIVVKVPSKFRVRDMH
ncbi:Flowering-promoting factor 1 [Ranunculus cassubicifolius]